MTINHNLLMQDILSLVGKKEAKSKQAIIKLENYDGQCLQIPIAIFMLEGRQRPCLSGCVSAVSQKRKMPLVTKPHTTKLGIQL